MRLTKPAFREQHQGEDNPQQAGVAQLGINFKEWVQNPVAHHVLEPQQDPAVHIQQPLGHNIFLRLEKGRRYETAAPLFD